MGPPSGHSSSLATQCTRLVCILDVFYFWCVWKREYVHQQLYVIKSKWPKWLWLWYVTVTHTHTHQSLGFTQKIMAECNPFVSKVGAQPHHPWAIVFLMTSTHFSGHKHQDPEGCNLMGKQPCKHNEPFSMLVCVYTLASCIWAQKYEKYLLMTCYSDRECLLARAS